MITIFEKFNVGKIDIGYYVICKDDDFRHPVINDFVSNQIGYIEDKDIIDGDMSYSVQYKDIPQDIRNWFSYRKGARVYGNEHILYWSKNRKELELILQAKKYNL